MYQEMKSDVDLERWLGSFSPKEFNSIKEIEDYFTLENCQRMWPGEEIDEDEMERAKRETVGQLVPPTSAAS